VFQPTVIRPLSIRPLSRPLAALAAVLMLAAATVAAAAPPAAHAKPIRRAGWLRGVTVTEYYPAPEWWFAGRRVAAPGLATRHRIDWLYSATGVSMEGDGIGLDGDRYHIDGLGSGGWVDARAKSVSAGRKGFSRSPVWRAGAYWLTRSKLLTYPLDNGGWSAGRGVRYVPLPGVSFAEGPSLPLDYYRSVAVDPDLIPLGSQVYIAAYRNTVGGGWFTAEDTGGAIIHKHVDVYRTPPARADIGGNYLEDQRIYVKPPGAKMTRGAPARSKPRQGGDPQPPIPQPPAPTPPARTDPSGGAGAP
jgi:3D (Asp-Asp-Asp) domain-containing protein